VSKSEGEMLKNQEFRPKVAQNEIKDVLSEMGAVPGMKLDGFSPPQEDSEEGGVIGFMRHARPASKLSRQNRAPEFVVPQSGDLVAEA